MEDKVILKTGELLNAFKAANTMMGCPGMAFRQVYWLKRLIDNMEVQLKKWNEIAKDVVKKHTIQMPVITFIPPQNYMVFKNDLIQTMANPMEGAGVEDVFAKYEVQTKTEQTVVPMENKEAFEKEMNEEAEQFSAEISYNKIQADAGFMNALRQLPGGLQLSITFAFEEYEPSSIIVPSPRMTQ